MDASTIPIIFAALKRIAAIWRLLYDFIYRRALNRNLIGLPTTAIGTAIYYQNLITMTLGGLSNSSIIHRAHERLIADVATTYDLLFER